MCCQESGEREAIVQLFCPKAKAGEPKVRRVSPVLPMTMLISHILNYIVVVVVTGEG
jgi:hypothetical protein